MRTGYGEARQMQDGAAPSTYGILFGIPLIQIDKSDLSFANYRMMREVAGTSTNHALEGGPGCHCRTLHERLMQCCLRCLTVGRHCWIRR